MGKEFLAGLDPVISLNTGVPCSAAFPHPSGFGTEEAHKEGRTNEQPFTGPHQLPSFPGSHSSNKPCRRAAICIYYSEFRGGGKWKKKQIEELLVAFLPPLVPCCVGCDAGRDKGSAPDITQVPHVPSLLLEWLWHNPKIRTGSQSSPSLFTPSWFPPSLQLSNPKLCWRAQLHPEQSTRDRSPPADFSWALLVSLKTLFCSHHLEPAHILCQFCLVATNNAPVRQQHDYSFISLILSAFAFQGATLQQFWSLNVA